MKWPGDRKASKQESQLRPLLTRDLSNNINTAREIQICGRTLGEAAEERDHVRVRGELPQNARLLLRLRLRDDLRVSGFP